MNRKLILPGLILFGYLIGNSSCTPKQNDNASEENIRKLKDSITTLMITFDTAMWEKALLLNDSILKIDTLQSNIRHNYQTRYSILIMLGRQEEAFDAMDKALPKDMRNVDRLIYNGNRSMLKGQKDSSTYYFSLALDICDSLVKQNYNTNTVGQKVGVLLMLEKKEEAKSLVKDALSKSPDDEILKLLEENIDDLHDAIRRERESDIYKLSE
ncbi:MAG: hypothetical protein QM660_06020 [Dysgonomonas sp.]